MSWAMKDAVIGRLKELEVERSEGVKESSESVCALLLHGLEDAVGLSVASLGLEPAGAACACDAA